MGVLFRCNVWTIITTVSDKRAFELGAKLPVSERDGAGHTSRYTIHCQTKQYYAGLVQNIYSLQVTTILNGHLCLCPRKVRPDHINTQSILTNTSSSLCPFRLRPFLGSVPVSHLSSYLRIMQLYQNFWTNFESCGLCVL